LVLVESVLLESGRCMGQAKLGHALRGIELGWRI
jgi:hypothetical protein